MNPFKLSGLIVDSGGSRQRWLILEQAEVAPDWVGNTGVAWRICRAGGIGQWTAGAAAPSESQVVCLAFCRRGDYDRLPSWLRNEGYNDWRVWCHYGGNLHPGDVGARWRTWSGLTQEDKQHLFASESGHPMPFSKVQKLPGSDEILAVKQAVKRATGRGGAWEGEEWGMVLCNLDTAWTKAKGGTDLHQRLRTVSQTLPAAMAARHLLDVLPWHGNLNVEEASMVLTHYRSSGFPDFASLFEVGSDADLKDLKKHYDAVRHAFVMVGYTWRALGPRSVEEIDVARPRPGVSNLRDWFFKARDALESFVALYQNDSRILSSQLCKSPHSISPN